jgi:V-type H+-transporting ATPase subunit a
MSLVQLFVPTEVARDIIYKIGQLNLIQFRDLNSKVNAFQRSFVKELRYLDNIERQYNYFKKLLDLKNIEIVTFPYDVQPNVAQSEIDEFGINAQLLEDRLTQLTDATESLYDSKRELLQLKYSIQGVDDFFNMSSNNSSIEFDTGEILESQFALNETYITGVISRDKVGTLQQILWRVLRGNLYYHSCELSEPIYDAKSNTFIDKDYFIIFSHGSLIQQRIRKICESLDASIYHVDYSQDLRKSQLQETNHKLSDLSVVLQESENALTTELIAISKDLGKWWEVIAREKAVYKSMNLCDYDESRSILIAEGWIPKDDLDLLTDTIKSDNGSGLRFGSNSEAEEPNFPTIVNVLSTSRTPPTFHRTNKFTAAFQSIVDAYGIASYREVNPGLPTIITFPFMFAIMFGDLGHGFLLSLAAFWLVYNEKMLGAMKRDEIFDMAYSGRYILLLMGVFSMYTGFLYNDLFSKSMTIFTSGWVWPEYFKENQTVEAIQVGTYAFGLDSAWHGAENALLFTNSYKMKLSILMGYLHMTYSYMFSLVNYVHFNSMIDIIGNFIPGLLFMQSIFGYLSLCIVYKWSIDWLHIGEQPPGLLNMLISMFLSPGTVAEPLYNGQAKLQVILLLIALVCVPWLLLLKPLYLKKQLDAEYQQLPEHSHEGHDDEEHEQHTFGDVMIHQVIHTIEFCLNCVSHTASYLRLWALSLAHAQLSTVLWSMTIGNAFFLTGTVGVIMTVILFGMWFILTVVILVMMEGTSAMLHSLRLHWVESMSKFFVGEGTLYEPFGFKGLLDNVL